MITTSTNDEGQLRSTRAAGYTRPTNRPRASDRVGYLIGVAVNAVMLYVAHQLLEWGWPSVLTGEFGDVLPLITVTIVASMVTNALYFWYDAPWFKSLGDIVTSATGLLATVRLFQVFPFDFSPYDFNWSLVVRLVLIVAMVGTAIGLAVSTVSLLRSQSRPSGS